MISKREIEQLQKEILYPTYFDKYHNVKIKDLTVHDKYNQILQVALKTQNNQKKIKSLSQAIDMQKSLQKLLRHGFNATNIEVDDIHLMRRMQDNDQERKAKEFLQNNPTLVDELVQGYYNKHNRLTKKNVIRLFGPTQRQVIEDEREQERLEKLEKENPIRGPKKHSSTSDIFGGLARTSESKQNQRRASIANNNLSIKYLSQHQQKKLMKLQEQLGEMGDVKNLDDYSLANQYSKKSYCSYRSTKKLNVLQTFEQNAYKNKISRLDTIYKRGQYLKMMQEKQEQEEREKQRQKLEEEKKQLEKEAAEAEANSKRTFPNQHKSRLMKDLSKHDFVLTRVSQKLVKASTNVKSIDQIVNEIVQKEDNNLKKAKSEKEKEFMKRNFLIMEKLDFTKKFFEPILEEKDLHGDIMVKSKVPRHIIHKMNIQNSPGIVAGIDKEHASSPDFNKQQQKFFGDMLFRKQNPDFFLTSIQEMEKKKTLRESMMNLNATEEDNISPSKMSPYLNPFKAIFGDVNVNSRLQRALSKNQILKSDKIQLNFNDSNKQEMITQYTNSVPLSCKAQSQVSKKRPLNHSKVYKTLIDDSKLSNNLYKTSSHFSTTKLGDRQQNMQKVKDLTGIIWSCANQLDSNQAERKTFFSVEKYTKQEFRELEDKFETIHGVNDLLNEL
ncbi:UNKNOWN [Stylonychia lemnae]|uniref:Uncharacterized protein n=1 Tax=Stylonychia lemnae TaxID=5949 RepID=A0A077ZXI6_STYLE|nr:UNKNOWN [Stylonychia lemnae]|eukprot:CDW74615.1 UNKNOWN [Stylonychia lemnae]